MCVRVCACVCVRACVRVFILALDLPVQHYQDAIKNIHCVVNYFFQCLINSHVS